MYTSVIFSTGTLDFSKADLIATAPSLGAETVTKAPLNFPVGVLEALRIYASWISFLAEVVALKWRWTCDNRCFEEAAGFLAEDMANRRDMLDMKGFKSVYKAGN